AQGVLFGLTHDHAAGAIGHAVAEGVAFGLRDGFESLDPSLQQAAGELDLVGGGARSAAWAQLIASVLERPLVQRDGADLGAALGAARLAWLADGGAESEVCRALPVQRRFEPDRTASAGLRERHARYRALYPALRGHW
ncbi:MAG TPA: FGGY-family carbohydrate kinase, partial [Albitalea sp.]|nr:FGGY-family carbohydrate kinase [Albitalea sp.]